MMQQPIRFGLFALILRAAAAQTQPDVADILKKVSETYKAASDYELVANLTMKYGINKGKSGHMVFAFKAPNRYRMESAIPSEERNAQAPEKYVIVHDGSTVWLYLPESNQYVSFPAIELTDDASGVLGDLGDMRPEAVDHFMMGRYRGATDFTEVKFLREEAIEFSGARVDCYVVTVSLQKGGFTYTWWVDKKNSRILREDNVGSSSMFTTVKLGEPLAAELFRFKVPPGARKVEAQR